ncbi:hypothetical protein N7481_007054 [Penicillium waksmanii]|uniref:uncharacterized protein n=1 Tax=Penicillium waksmanii TaxID=69791 RepID=UPI0025491A85|nr:uncharacterized protein N7481_007054 [Penicillium waksmanii]KAJ5979756.1 hypothetical protein N7481_007054 [Penicillium waksmanii]
MAPFRDEHLVLIAPGSELTLAQLGLPEAYCPAKLRLQTRMFPAEKPGEYEPHRIRKVTTPSTSTTAPTSIPGASGQPPKEDVEMKDDGASAPREETVEGAEKAETEPAQEVIYEEDVMSDEGAVYPIRDGRIVNRNAFFALIQHPSWTQTDREEITRFVFEHFSTPGFAYVDAALSVAWGYGVLTALVIDVGKTKTDVSAVINSVPQRYGRGIALSGCGGDAMTDRLLELLGSKGFTREMCEQLKRSDIAEILPPGTPLPGAAATAHQSTPAIPPGESAGGNFPRTEGASENNGTDEGVLDVAAIVSGDTSEYLANMEKDKSTGKKIDPKQPNAQKERASFQFEEFVEMENDTQAGGSKRYKRNTREITVGVERFLAATPRQRAGPLLSNGILEDIASQVQYAINCCPNDKRNELWSNIIIVGAGSRVRGFNQALLGAISQKFLNSPSASIFTSEIPSTFSTPLPTGGTNTPAQIGPGQPQPGLQHHPAAHGVNPLLVAATHNNPGMPTAPGTPGMDQGQQHRAGHFQGPTVIKATKFPEYNSEFKGRPNSNAPGATSGPGSTSRGGHGPEEAVFLGAQVCAKVFFVIDQGQLKTFMSRTEYNEFGPEGMGEFCIA